VGVLISAVRALRTLRTMEGINNIYILQWPSFCRRKEGLIVLDDWSGGKTK
jgi:hypothetical protein